MFVISLPASGSPSATPNGLLLFFYGTPGSSPVPGSGTATANIWLGFDETTSDGATTNFGAIYLGQVKLHFGTTPGDNATYINDTHRFFCDIDVIAPDRALTPPGLRPMGGDASEGAANLFFDTLGAKYVIVQIAIDNLALIGTVRLCWRVA